MFFLSHCNSWCSYLGHLLGHESGGSILSALKARRWANGLSSGSYLMNRDFACFTLTIELSDEGVNHTEDIAACVFAYIGMYVFLRVSVLKCRLFWSFLFMPTNTIMCTSIQACCSARVPRSGCGTS